MLKPNFEFLAGEFFRRRQFSIEKTEAVTKKGISFLARKGLEKYLIQGLHRPVGNVGVQVVQKLHGTVAGAGATGGIVLTSGVYTGNARAIDATLIYKSVKGIVVSLNRDEVKSIKKTKVDD